MSLQVTRRGAYVHPVGPRWDVRKKCFALFEELWEQAIFKRIILTLWNQVEDLWLKDVRARINVATISFSRFGLFHEPPNATVLVCFNDAVHAGVVDRN